MFSQPSQLSRVFGSLPQRPQNPPDGAMAAGLFTYDISRCLRDIECKTNLPLNTCTLFLVCRYSRYIRRTLRVYEDWEIVS